MRRRRTLLTVIAVAFLVATGCLPSSAPQAASTPGIKGPLSIKGNRIVDAKGATVVLRGIHRAYIDDPHATGGEVSPDEVVLATHGKPGSWNSSVVRVPMGSAQWTGECPSLYAGSPAYRKNIDLLVKRITDRGSVALLDLHVSTAGCTSIDRHAMPDAPITEHFWSGVAAHYAKNPLVAFELYNEPHYVTDSTWRDGTPGATVQDCDVTAPQASGMALVSQQLSLAGCQFRSPKYRAAGMQELYDIVAKAAPKHLIFINGPGYASNVSTLPVKGSFVYAFHPYTCSVPGATCDVSDKAHANIPLLDKWKAVAKKQPVMASELGWPSYSGSGSNAVYVDGSGYYRETLAYLEKQSPKWGFAAFAWDGGSRGGFSMVSDTGTYAPNSTAKPVFDLLRSR
ncbi:MAG: cellulose-binding family [Frankiales bacterium]|nr:cellulose-binding family [Frankiales bacterium]